MRPRAAHHAPLSSLVVDCVIAHRLVGTSRTLRMNIRLWRYFTVRLLVCGEHTLSEVGDKVREVFELRLEDPVVLQEPCGEGV